VARALHTQVGELTGDPHFARPVFEQALICEVRSRTESTLRVASVGKEFAEIPLVLTFLGMLFLSYHVSCAGNGSETRFDVQRASRVGVDVHKRALEENTFPGDFEALRLISQKTFHHRFDLATQHTFLRPGKTGVRKEKAVPPGKICSSAV